MGEGGQIWWFLSAAAFIFDFSAKGVGAPASTIQIINFSTSGTILYSNENNVAMVVYCHVYMQTILHILKSSRGRLVQWEIVRLPIQRSGSNSRRNRWLFFLAVAFKYAGPRTFRITFQQKINQRHLLDTRKAVFKSLSVWKGTYLQISPMTSRT